MTIHGVFFNPAGTTYQMTGTFAGITDTPVGTLSFWVRGLNPVTTLEDGFITILGGGNGTTHAFWQADVNSFNSQSSLNNSFHVANVNGTFLIGGGEDWIAGNFTKLATLDTAYVWLQDGLWHHVLASWDFNHTTGSRIYKLAIDRWVVPYCVENANDRGASFSSSFSTYTIWDMGFGGGDIAELWFAPGQYLDVTDPTVINKFVDTGGNPTDLGTDGSTPTGTKPILYLSLRTATATDWLTNRGSGGGTWALTRSVAVVLSDSDPVIQNPIRSISGSSETVTMRSTAYGALPLTVIPNVLGSEFYVAPTGDIPFEWDNATGLVPVRGAITALHDDGTSATRTTITPAVDGSVFSPLPTGIGAATAYFPVVDISGDAPAQDFALMSLNTGAVTGPFTISDTAWMTAEFNLRWYVTTATMIWWDGKEQCVALMDSVNGSGQACMTDAEGNVTTAKIWGGWNLWDSAENINSREQLFLICSPDSVTGHNRFITSVSENGWFNNTVTYLIADSTGTDISRALLRADDPIADSLIQGFDYPFGPFFSATQPVANAQGFHYSGVSDAVVTWTGLKVAPDGDSFTKYTFIPDPTDRVAKVILNSVGNTNCIFVSDATRKWLVLTPGIFMQLELGFQTILLEDLTLATTNNSINMIPLTQIDTTTSGVQFSGGGWVVQGAGTTSYTSVATPVDPDYKIDFAVSSRTIFGFGGTAVPLDGQSMFAVGRADGSNNGYKTGVVVAGGQYHFQFQIMPSGAVTDIPMGSDGSYYVTLYMVDTSIQVQVSNGSVNLAPDGSWTGGLAIDITDSTYTDAGKIIFGGVGV